MILDKMVEPNAHLACDDLTPNQKKHLWTVMMRHGASQGFAYDRFFKEGFREWELLGIDNVKRDFLKKHEDKLGEADADVGFYDCIGKARLKLAFVDYMGSLGMGSNTVLVRFGKNQEEDFKNYERIGIRAVIKEFEREARELDIR